MDFQRDTVCGVSRCFLRSLLRLLLYPQLGTVHGYHLAFALCMVLMCCVRFPRRFVLCGQNMQYCHTIFPSP